MQPTWRTLKHVAIVLLLIRMRWSQAASFEPEIKTRQRYCQPFLPVAYDPETKTKQQYCQHFLAYDPEINTKQWYCQHFLAYDLE